MKARELRQLTLDSLRARELELGREMASLSFGGLEREKNKKKLRLIRHERARVLTILNERQKAARLRQGCAGRAGIPLRPSDSARASPEGSGSAGQGRQ